MNDMHNSTVSELLRIAEIQLIESEMEKKHKCELLYHMTRQKLEMCQLRKELGTISDMKDTTPVSTSKRKLYGLNKRSPLFKSFNASSEIKIEEKANCGVRDNVLNNFIGDDMNTEEWEELAMQGKIPDLPGSPELGPAKSPWSNDVGRPKYSGKYKNKEIMRDLLQLYDKYDSGGSKGGLLRDFVGKSRKSYTSNFNEENTTSKFNAALFKTEICRSWSEFGLCPYSHNCRYAHGLSELRMKPKPHWKFKTERCKKFLSGYCPYGSRCCFVHSMDELQKPVGRGFRGDARSTQRTVM